MFQNFNLRRELTGAFLVAMLAGCGGYAMSASDRLIGAAPPVRARQPARSWIAPTASGKTLLYVSDGNENVYVYTYPQGQHVGTLTGFIQPSGECVNSAGDVFIVSQANESRTSGIIYKYAHGGSSPIATLIDPNPAYGCAVDLRSGDLAVAGGGVAVYKQGSGDPVIYDGSEGFYFCGYDTKGNLYLSARDTQYLGQDQLARLPAGRSQVEQIGVNVTLYDGDFASPSSVQWDGEHVTVSSAPEGQPVYVYRLHISRDRATVVGTTTLSSQKNGFKSGQVWIQGSRALGADLIRGRGGVDLWSYPNAGKPRSIVGNRVNFAPFGIAVSPAASQ
jgi:hypothetical protein